MIFNKYRVLVFIVFLVASQIAPSQPTIEVKMLDNPITIDGKIDSSEWQGAQFIEGFIQLEPDKGKSSVRNTKVMAAQYQNHLYFAFICQISNREEVVSRIQRRDQLDDGDDLVAVVLDTYRDKRTALVFLVNALGTLADGKITDDGKNEDFLWDTEWEAQVSLEDNHWTVEIGIRFDNIQYKPGSDSWGVNFGRVSRINQEISWWVPVTENFRISQSGTLNGVQPGGKQEHHLRLFPYGTLRYDDSDITEVYKEVNADAGLDLTYQYGSNVIANVTFNPDFATVEGDRELINLTPWELRFPEKRLFFQDGNELFQTRISTFYSRRIGDLNYGAKTIGKAGKYQFNALVARTKANEETGDPKAFYNALRIKRDVLQSSSFGLTYADKITDTTYIRSLSFDYALNLGKTWKLTGQFVGSAPGHFGSHAAWFVRFAREDNIYHYHIRYSNIGSRFQDNVNQTGFIPDDDRHELDSDISYRFWMDKGIKYISLEGLNNIFWSQEGTLRSWYLTYTGRMYLKSKWSLDFAYNNEYKLLDKDYHNHFYLVNLGYNTDEASFSSISYQAGRNFDRDFQLLQFNLRFQLFTRLTLSYELNWLEYEPDLSNSSTFINVLGADFFFNKDLWIRVFTQNNTAADKFYFYGLFGWRFKPPFGAVYLIVSTDKYDEFPGNEKIRSEIVFLKVTYPVTIF